MKGVVPHTLKGELLLWYTLTGVVLLLHTLKSEVIYTEGQHTPVC